VGKVRHAIKSVAAGADVVAAQGTEAGGHTGEVGGLALIPQVVDAVHVPVLAAGGIADGRGVVAALALGAQGVVVGTRFIATPEAQASRAYRDAIIAGAESDTVRTRCYTGKPARTIRNPYNEMWERKAHEIQPFPIQYERVGKPAAIRAREQGDVENGSAAAGQSAGLIHDVRSAGDVVASIVEEAEALLDRLARRGEA
jgi:enoyl-[acyl-carrier protein] reductase II